MFRRVSYASKMIRPASRRRFTNEPLYGKPDAPLTKKQNKLFSRTTLAQIIVFSTLLNVASCCGYFNEVLFARQFVTEEDLREYRSQPRNVFQGKSDSEARMALMKLSAEADRKVFEMTKERRKAASAEIVATRRKEARDGLKQFLHETLWMFGATDRDRAIDSFMSFYHTYAERAELTRRTESAKAKAAKKLGIETGSDE